MTRRVFMPAAGIVGALVIALLLLPGVAAGASQEIWILAQPWPASFSAEELAAALRLRLPSLSVRVVGVIPEGAGDPFVEVVAADPPRIRLRRRDQVLLDAPLPELGKESGRRAAILAAIALETAAAETQTARSDPPAARAADTAPAAAVALPAPPPTPGPRWALSVAVGPALAVDDDTADVAPALLLRFRAPLGHAVSFEVGGKLSGAYGASTAVDLSIVDRAVWLGASYRVTWGAIASDLTLAAQFSHPAIDVDGETEPVESPLASRFGVRASADVAWSVHRNLAVVLVVAMTFGLADRDFTIGTRDVAELGAATLDVAVGPEVRW